MKKLPQTCSSLPRFPQINISGSGGENTGLGEEIHSIRKAAETIAETMNVTKNNEYCFRGWDFGGVTLMSP